MTSDLPRVIMPERVPAPQREAWLLAGRLHELRPDGWTVVGGQMVQFHAWWSGVPPVRTTTDLDVGIAARTDPSAFPDLSRTLQDLGLKPVLHPSGVEHRWSAPLEPAGQVRVDLLLPSGLGERGRASFHGRPGVQSRGVQWATELSRSWRLVVGQREIVVPVPSLLGAVVAKSSALLNSGDAHPDRHLSDLRFLAGIATREDLLEPLSQRQAARVLMALDQLEPDVPVERLRLAMEHRSRR